ncbi:MAG: Cyclic di-GMP phosphodiesterase response regulator RpfG [Firmicutes bacterium ADurb.Bin456]|nr:MAG: Cyclic di-GMP phosphodiesterase response regulator RpfG [Firmicutes bacterium ADurb.Bin456]
MARWGGDEFVLLLPKTNLAEAGLVVERIKDEFSREQVKAIKGSISMGADTKENTSVDIMGVLDNAEERMYGAKTLERDEFRAGLIDSIIMSLHQNSTRQKEHSHKVSELCEKLGRVLNLPEVKLRKLKEAGYLHDIGKAVLDPEIVDRSYQPGVKEIAGIKKHPVVGYRILNSFDATMNLAELVLSHHENWDGSGYPRGLKGEEIPLLARIIRLADSFEWMINGSESTGYKSIADALAAIKEKAGTQFEPRLVELFQLMVQSGDVNLK